MGVFRHPVQGGKGFTASRSLSDYPYFPLQAAVPEASARDRLGVCDRPPDSLSPRQPSDVQATKGHWSRRSGEGCPPLFTI